MPNTRWWAFEDYRTNFGELRPDVTDPGKLFLMEFGLVYTNDWFIVPSTLPVGTLAEVKGIALSNVFGERFWIEPVAQPPEAKWDKWTMFTLSTAAEETEQPPAQLVLLPTLPAKLESAPIEQFALIRDEMANMVWGVELKIPLASGASGNGRGHQESYSTFFKSHSGKKSKPKKNLKLFHRGNDPQRSNRN